MSFNKTTESNSKYNHLEKMTVKELLVNINNEDKTVPLAIEKVIPAIESLVTDIVVRMNRGGRIFYMGAGTSGRLGIVDASECPPTFGVPHGLVVGIIAGGDIAIRKAVEFAEDDIEQGWKDLSSYDVNEDDTIIGIAASGTTPYVIEAMRIAQSKNILTACITCNASSPITEVANHKIEAVVGAEFLTGSTRMKAGTAQKLVLNMISTAVMIQLGRVKGNKMVDMQLSNHKLIDRGTKMVMDALNIEENIANKLLVELGSVRKAIDYYQSQH
jgi:N-acetylmuramic acid 6-phosphate etherase